MAESTIDIIRHAEIEAEKILLQAAQESNRVKDEAIALAAHTRKLAEANAQTMADATVCVAREKSAHALREAEASLEEELEALRQKAESLQKPAVAAVVTALVH